MLSDLKRLFTEENMGDAPQESDLPTVTRLVTEPLYMILAHGRVF